MNPTRKSWLSGTGEDGQPARWLIEKSPFTLGRKPPADLQLPHARVSRLHARIEYRDWGYHLTDLDSRNGTFINGEPVNGTMRLVGGDEIVLGGVVVLAFIDPDETEVGPKIGRIQGVWIDPTSQHVYVDSAQLDPPLSIPQLRLLALLYNNEDKPMSREQIIRAVWPDENPDGISKQALDGLIKRVRQRLRQASANGIDHDYVQVVRGFGLRFVQRSEE